jgi:cell division transport system permease protein
MFFEFLMFWMRETAFNIRRNSLMSLLAVTTATVGLFILGAFYLLTSLTRATVQEETQKIDLAIFLKNDVSVARREQIMKAARIPQVRDLQLVLRSQVLREMKRDWPHIPLDDFQDKNNPLSDELRIKLRDPQDLFKVRAYLTSLKGVRSDTRTPGEDEVVRGLLAVSRFLTIAGVVSLAVLGMAILLIIHNAIRLTIFARRREIRIMELVGATHTFISVPFLWEGVIYGVVGAAIASFFLSILHRGLMGLVVSWSFPVPQISMLFC